ncbi:MAG: hypothetical protein ABIA76_00580 [Candidatus Diapherotrites archaeon]
MWLMIDFIFGLIVFFALDALFIWFSAGIAGVKSNSFESALKSAVIIFLITGFLALIFIPLPVLAFIYILSKIIVLKWAYQCELWQAIKIWAASLVLALILGVIMLM